MDFRLLVDRRTASLHTAGTPGGEPAAAVASRRGFTLVELLAVIVIIGILVGLVTAALMAARKNVRIARISMELQNLDQALRNYQEKYGELPPDCSNIDGTYAAVNATTRTKARGEIIRHLLRAYPRLDQTLLLYGGNPGASIDSQWDRLRNYINTGYALDINRLNPSSALVFWFGGLWQLDASSRPIAGKLGGFSSNPANPFDNSPTRQPLLFEFDPTRVFQPSNQMPCYGPDTGSGNRITPYIYFKARSYGVQVPGGSTSFPGYDPGGALGPAQFCTFRNTTIGANETVYPYYHAVFNTSGTFMTNSEWYEAKRFQLLCAGLDGLYGTAYCVPLGTAVPPAPGPYNGTTSNTEADNQANFLKGTLEEQK